MISIRNIHKRFGSQIVLNGISLDIEPGRTTAVVGPSGVGKSVLLKLIMGIMEPDQGEILIFGRSITSARSERKKNSIRGSLGVLFQSAALFDSLTVYENIAFPLRERSGSSRKEIHNKVVGMMDALSLCPYAENFPEEISMGMRKRVGMARSLIMEPKVVLFDEPNTGLDPLVGQEVYDLIKECREKWGFAGVVISHEIPEVFQVSDRVVMLLNGNIIEEGSPKDLMSSHNLAVRQFWKVELMDQSKFSEKTLGSGALSVSLPKRRYTVEFFVGLFTMVGLAAVAYLAVGLGGVSLSDADKYQINAEFDNISGLKYGASVEIAGVPIGEVSAINLKDPVAIVTLTINRSVQIKDDDIASIRTKGIIGDRYVKISRGASDKIIQEGGRMTETESVVDIEDIIGKIVHSLGSDDEKDKSPEKETKK